MYEKLIFQHAHYFTQYVKYYTKRSGIFGEQFYELIIRIFLFILKRTLDQSLGNIFLLDLHPWQIQDSRKKFS